MALDAFENFERLSKVSFEFFRPADIKLGDKNFIFWSNFGIDIYPSTIPNQNTRRQNKLNQYFSLAKLGVGIIPELPPRDFEGREMSSGHAFYRREEVDSEQILKTINYLYDSYPEAFDTVLMTESQPAVKLSRGEVDLLVEEAVRESGLEAQLALIDQQ